ncbi:hypothetical protein B0H19DRAFT_1271785 [Mycena capillaripes]|nr:hypothetical protein B0H19DRAFT_1271785 [Mycena capillaripes]
MQYTIDSDTFDSGWDVMMRFFLATGLSLVLYGIYICLFMLAIYTLSRRKIPGGKLLIGFSCVMAVLGTIQTAANLAITTIDARVIGQILRDPSLNGHISLSTLTVLGTVLSVTSTINNAITDSLFLYRCYVIWGFQRKILILPILLMLSTSVVAVVRNAQYDEKLDRILDIKIQQVAGRILWIRRAARHVGLDNTFRKRYNTAIAMVIESGAIYTFSVIFLAITADLSLEIFTIGSAVAPQLLNIIPTSTLVYVGLSNAVYDTSAGDQFPAKPYTSIAVQSHKASQRLEIVKTEEKEVEYV